jgi:hypothetical protein
VYVLDTFKRLRVTPNSTSSLALDNTGGLVALGGASTYMQANSYFDGTNWISINGTSWHLLYAVDPSPSFTWFACAPLAAGNPIGWTTAMTLDQSGNLTAGASIISGLHLSVPATNMIYWRGAAGVHMDYMNFGATDTAANALNCTLAFRRNWDNIVIMGITGAGYVNIGRGYGAYNGADNGYGYLAPNTANTQGEGVAYAWVTYSSVPHALQYGLKVAPITDPVSLLKSVNAYAYEHMSFDAEGAPLRDAAGAYASTPSYGFHAGEIARDIPEAAAYDQAGEPIGVDPYRLLAILWEATQELELRIAALETPA